MRSIGLLSRLAVLLGCSLAALPVGAATAGSRPHIVVILADDMGWGDPGCYQPGSVIRTPHMDALAGEGMRFTQAHTPSAVCSPTRYGLLTGRYAWRTRMKEGVLDGFAPPLIELDRPNLAAFLRAQGYATACFGKWHLGMQWLRPDGSPLTGDLMLQPRKGFRSGEEVDTHRRLTAGPTTIGFDTYFGIAGSLDMAPYSWIENDRCLIELPSFVADDRREMQNLSPGIGDAGFDRTEVLATLTKRTVEHIDRHFRRPDSKPLFLYLPLNSPHVPLAPSKHYVGRSPAGVYGDFMIETDDFVGAVTDALRRHGQLDNAIVVLTSDNGGLWHIWNPVEADDVAGYKPHERGLSLDRLGHRSNGNLRGTKADIYEGGHRVPFIIRWPAAVKPGSVCTTPVELTDVFATVADVLGQTLPAEAAPDSFSLLPLLKNPSSQSFARPFLVHHSLHGVFAVRRGPWKFVESRGSGGFSSPKTVNPAAGEPTGQLYHMDNDPLETRNLFASEPARVAELQRLLDEVRRGASVRALARDPAAAASTR